MKKRTKQLVSMTVAGLMAVSMVGCGSSSSSSSSAASSSSSAAATAADSASGTATEEGSVPGLEEALNPSEKVTINMWSIANDSDSYHDSYEKAIADFEETYPNVDIEMEYFENESYKQKLKSAIAADEIPDIVYSWSGGFSQGFAEAGKLLDLTPYYDAEYTDLLPESSTSNARYNDGILYGTAYSLNCSCLMYNTEIFDKYNLEAPETWDDFVACCQTLVDNGVTPLACGVKDAWCLCVIHDALALKSAGHEAVVNTLTHQDGGNYDTDEFLYAAEQIKELVDMGAFIDGAAGLNYDEANQAYKNGDAAMLIQLANVCSDIASEAEEGTYDVVPFPVVGDNAASTDMIGGCSETFIVNANTENPDIAAYTAFELSRRIANNAQAEGITTSPWTDSDPAELSAFDQKIADMKADATSYVLWWDTTMTSDDAAEYLSLIQQLFTEDISPEDFVAGMTDQLS